MTSSSSVLQSHILTTELKPIKGVMDAFIFDSISTVCQKTVLIIWLLRKINFKIFSRPEKYVTKSYHDINVSYLSRAENNYIGNNISVQITHNFLLKKSSFCFWMHYFI